MVDLGPVGGRQSGGFGRPLVGELRVWWPSVQCDVQLVVQSVVQFYGEGFYHRVVIYTIM